MHSNTLEFPLPIVTPRLIMRQPTLASSDIYEHFSAVTESMSEISQWLPWAKFYPSLSQTEDYIRACNASWITKNDNNIGLPLWIMSRDNKKFIGNIVIWNIVWEIPKFEFGYWLRSSQTQKGYITEAVNALTRYCFSQLGIRRIEIRCEKENLRAQLVPKRLGFELDGVLHNSTLAVSNGQLTDILIFSRIDQENLPELEVLWGK